MKFKMLLFVLSCFSILSLFSQKSDEISKLEKQADSIYYQLTTPRDESSYLLERKLRGEVLESYADTISPDYRLSLAKKHASEALFLMERKHEYVAAIDASNKALAILETLEKQDLVFKGHLYRFLYHQFAYSGDWVTALPMTKKTREIFMDTLVADHKLVANVEFDIGFVAAQFGDRSTELKQYNIAKDKYVSFQGKNTYDVAQKYLHLATVYGFIGYSKKELDSYLESIQIWETIDYHDKSYQAIAYGNVGAWYLGHGDYEKAEQFYIKREKFIEKHKKENTNWYNETFLGRTKLNTLRSYADLYLQKKDTLKASKLNDEILEYLLNFDFEDKRNDPNNIGSIKNFVKYRTIIALRFKADLLKSSDPVGAKELHEQILRIREKNSLGVSTLPDLMYLSDFYFDRELFAEARAILNTGIDEALEKTDDYNLMQFYAKQAALAIQADSISLMKEKYKQVFNKLQKDPSKRLSLNTLNYLDCKPYGDFPIINFTTQASRDFALAFKNTNDFEYLKIAHNLSQLASDMFAVNNRDLKYNDQSFTTVSNINEELLQTSLLMKENANIEEVLQTIEKSKSRRSWQAFLGSKARKKLNVPDSIIEKENELNAELHFYKKSLFIDNSNDSLKNKVWKEKLLDTENEFDSLEFWYKKNYPSYFNLTQKKFDLPVLKKTLSKKQKLVNYVFAKEQVFAFMVNRDTTKLIRIGSKQEVKKLLRSLIQSLTIKNSIEYREFAKALHKILLPESILSSDKKEELVFVRDDLLHYLPMEILINEDGQFLLQKHAVSYTPSLLLWNEQMQVKSTKRNKLGIFAPTYNDTIRENEKREGLGRLVGARSEAGAISELFSSDIFSGEQSNKQAFLENASDYGILHLAMHSTLNNVDSEFSNLSFSGDSEDEKLFISELYGMSINADLAVLSACNTGVGTLKAGEGLMDLSRAFTYAGVPSSVTSLWKVPDKQTSQIMVNFYKNLKEGLPKNIALQNAKLEYLNSTKDELLKHPYYWAGFVVSGNIEPLHNSNYISWWVLVIVVFGISVWWLQRNSQSN